MVNFSLEGKVALVTGGSYGIGFAIASAYAEAGATICFNGIHPESVERGIAKYKEKGIDVHGYVCDVTDEDAVQNMVEATVKTFGRLDYAYNNAGIMGDDIETARLASSEFDRIVNTNMRSVFLCMKYELTQMRKQGSGAIVNCSSLGGLVGNPGRAAYHAAKHGVLGLTKSAAIEYAPRGIRINAVCPGTIETPMVKHMVETGDLSREAVAKLTPIGRLGRAEEVADVVLWLCSHYASYVIGQSIAVDGGYTII